MDKEETDFSVRDAAPGVSDLFRRRWSPRAFLPRPIAQEDLATIFDAARWSPSCFNEQPWQFYTSTEGSYERFLRLLVEGNQAWVKTAPLIGFVVAAKTFARNGKENRHAAFDAGAAWMAFNLQAEKLGMHAHGMGGVHYDEVYRELAIDPQTHRVICGFALGYKNPEVAEPITSRKPLSEIWRPVS